jgi:hypothetical protein
MIVTHTVAGRWVGGQRGGLGFGAQRRWNARGWLALALAAGGGFPACLYHASDDQSLNHTTVGQR